MKVVVATKCSPERFAGVENLYSPVAMSHTGYRTVALPQPPAGYMLKPIRAAMARTPNPSVQ